MAYVFANGTGTEADPYQVATADDLNGVRDYLSAYFIQMADIDLSGYENWEPIGNADNAFSGTYDGNGHEITNLTIAGENGLAGLFSAVLWATLENINLRNVDISLNYGGHGNCYGGGLAALFSNSTATNCSITGDISVERFSEDEDYVDEVFVGGLFGICGGETPGIITDCLNACNVSCSVLVSGQNAAVSGGIVGFCGMLTITNCYNIGNISSSSKNYMGVAGGLIGYGYPVEATNCFNQGNVSGEVLEVVIDDGSCVVGGFSGLAIGKIINCYSTGSVSGVGPSNLEIGGLVGFFHSDVPYKDGEKSCVISSYYDTETSGCSDTGKGEPKTTAEMKTQETFAGWDFETVWAIDPAKNDGYPYLQWQQFDPPPEPFQPWTPPKLEPSWWEGFKLPFNVLELDEDAPIAIQRNFKEIEHYINFLGKASGEIKDNLELLATAPAPMSEEEMPDPEPEVPPTDSYFAGYILGKEGQMGSIDAAIKTDSLGGINEVWIARVIDKQGIVEIYDSDAPEHIFRTVAREFNLPLVNLGADVVDVAIEFDGTYDQYNIFVSEASPHIFWVERTGSEDIIYTIKWDGVDPAPEPIELARAQLGYLGSGITVGLDPNITV